MALEKALRASGGGQLSFEELQGVVTSEELRTLWRGLSREAESDEVLRGKLATSSHKVKRNVLTGWLFERATKSRKLSQSAGDHSQEEWMSLKRALDHYFPEELLGRVKNKSVLARLDGPYWQFKIVRRWTWSDDSTQEVCDSREPTLEELRAPAGSSADGLLQFLNEQAQANRGEEESCLPDPVAEPPQSSAERTTARATPGGQRATAASSGAGDEAGDKAQRGPQGSPHLLPGQQAIDEAQTGPQGGRRRKNQQEGEPAEQPLQPGKQAGKQAGKRPPKQTKQPQQQQQAATKPTSRKRQKTEPRDVHKMLDDLRALVLHQKAEVQEGMMERLQEMCHSISNATPQDHPYLIQCIEGLMNRCNWAFKADPALCNNVSVSWALRHAEAVGEFVQAAECDDADFKSRLLANIAGFQHSMKAVATDQAASDFLVQNYIQFQKCLGQAFDEEEEDEAGNEGAPPAPASAGDPSSGGVPTASAGAGEPSFGETLVEVVADEPAEDQAAEESTKDRKLPAICGIHMVCAATTNSQTAVVSVCYVLPQKTSRTLDMQRSRTSLPGRTRLRRRPNEDRELPDCCGIHMLCAARSTAQIWMGICRLRNDIKLPKRFNA